MAEWYTRQSKANLAMHIVKQESDLAAARAEIERLRRMLDLRGTGPAERYWEGRWRDEAAENERLTKERDEALAQEAAAYEAAASIVVTGEPEISPITRHAITALTPAHAKAALEAYGREKVREGMQRAADIAEQCWESGYRYQTKEMILADMEKLK